ncbi:hypothetical protein H4W00_001753 [Psychrobacter sp. PL19]|uniref:hypothetical protein n=1 Tax=Psychrobacter sp. PL19 TaxID=2760711 RepID=UPI001AEB12EA
MIKNLRSRLSFFTRTSFPITIAALVALTSCSALTPTSPDMAENTASETQKPAVLTTAVQTVIGDYVSDGYDKRTQGYDWVSVMVRPSGNAEIDIKVRARADIKQPSCSFDGTAKLMGQDNAHGVIFQTVANDSLTFLQFKEGVLTIDSQDKYALNYFCAGGATLAGDYQKLAGNLKLS